MTEHKIALAGTGLLCLNTDYYYVTNMASIGNLSEIERITKEMDAHCGVTHVNATLEDIELYKNEGLLK